jgi:hypothetical protein
MVLQLAPTRLLASPLAPEPQLVPIHHVAPTRQPVLVYALLAIGTVPWLGHYGRVVPFP